jgi:tetratricopeptide (TPR) repeat protein
MVVETTGTTAITVATIKALAAVFGAALILSACSNAAGPVSPADAARTRAEIKTGVRAFGHHAYKIALVHFNGALALVPSSLDARYDRGVTEENLHAYGAAMDDLQSVVNNRPDWTNARFHLAAAQFQAHRFADSARNFDIALASNSKAGKLWLDDGVSYYRMKRYADARLRFARALALSPKSGRAHFWLGMTYRHLGNPKARGELALAAHSRDVVVRSAARRQLTAR